MRDHYKHDRNQNGEPVAAPSACPVCRGSDITTTSKVLTVETYWRCVACGEVWNVGRRQSAAGTRFGFYRS